MRPADPSFKARGPAGLLHGRDAAELKAYLVSFVLAGLIGVLGGLAALGFQRLTDLARMLWIGGTASEGLLAAARRLPWWKALWIPALGAAVASVLVYGVFRKVASQGAPDILETVSLRKGGIHLGGVL